MGPEANIVLPVSKSKIDDLLESKDPSGLLLSFNAPSLAGVLVLQQISGQKGKGSEVAMTSGRAVSTLLKGTKTANDLHFLQRSVAKTFSKKKVRAALGLISDFGISLCTDDEFRDVQPTRPDGSLNPNFSTEILNKRSSASYSSLDPKVATLGLNDPQGRAVDKIIADPEEHMHIQGYPGGGKTHLIRVLTNVLPADRTLVLAMRKSQLDGLLKGVSSDLVTGRTFTQLAAEIISDTLLPGQWESGNRSRSSYNVTGHQIAQHLGFGPVRSLQPHVVADICRRAVMSYCYTGHSQIGEQHLPVIRDRLDRTDKAVLTRYAQHYWEQTVEPDIDSAFLPVRGYHLIKYVSIKGWGIPARFQNVIIDESHDLTTPMMQILDRCMACVITLGDKFQRLDGKTPERSGRIRRSELDLTMRAGRDIEPVMNPLIESHPLAKDEPPLRATDRVKTICEYYDRPSIPEEPCTILVGGNWQLFEYFQRLSHEGVKFALLPGAYYQFKSFSEGLIDLFHDGVRAKDSYLFRYPDWNSLQQACGNIGAFKRIESMLRKGYTRPKLDESLAKLVSPSKAKYFLGRVDDARNLEFGSVMLTPELLPTGNTLQNKDYLSTAISRLYVGASRAQNKIILPGYMKDWLSDQ